MIQKEAWPFYRTRSSVRLCWELDEPKGPLFIIKTVLYERGTPVPRGGPRNFPSKSCPDEWVFTESKHLSHGSSAATSRSVAQPPKLCYLSHRYMQPNVPAVLLVLLISLYVPHWKPLCSPFSVRPRLKAQGVSGTQASTSL